MSETFIQNFIYLYLSLLSVPGPPSKTRTTIGVGSDLSELKFDIADSNFPLNSKI
jgi:hypothetical protein